MRRLLLALLLCLGAAHAAHAQSATTPYGAPVVTYPGVGVTGNSSATITSGGTYQQVFASTLLRKACTIQNNGTHTMYVYFGPIASATHATSIQLSAGQSVNCQSGGVILTDQVSIDGTTSDVFYAAQQ